MIKLITPILIVFIAIYIVLSLGALVGFRLGINTTQSEPRGLYSCTKLPNVIHHNDFIAFEMPKIKWIEERNYLLPKRILIKKVGATPGEYLFTDKDIIYSCKSKNLNKQCKRLGKCLNTDSYGKKVYCQNWYGYKIPENTYYMSSMYKENALDSRYLGLIKKNEMKYKVTLLWAFDSEKGNKL